MKKIVIALFILVALITTGCGRAEKQISKDEKKFKTEYESYNGKKNGDKKTMSLTIEDHNYMEYVNSKEALTILENKTGVIYFGFPTCPWCRNIVPILIDAANETSMERIYYANLLEERDSKRLDEDDEIVVEKEGSDNYHKIVEKLGDYLGSYEGLNDESIKRLYFPTVVFVKNGKVESVHIGTVDSQKDPYQKLNKKEQEELKKIYVKGIRNIQKLTCDTDKTC